MSHKQSFPVSKRRDIRPRIVPNGPKLEPSPIQGLPGPNVSLLAPTAPMVLAPTDLQQQPSIVLAPMVPACSTPALLATTSSGQPYQPCPSPAHEAKQ
ncbi:hypothetical protein V6N13_124120 [Hibiscus sabdariffa]